MRGEREMIFKEKNKRWLSVLTLIMFLLSNMVMLIPTAALAYQNGEWLETGPWGADIDAIITDGVDVYTYVDTKGIYVFNSGTNEWDLMTGLPSTTITGLTALSDGTLYGVMAGKGYKKNLGSSTWNEVTATVPSSAKYFKDSSDNILAINSSGLYRLTPGGTSFDSVAGATPTITDQYTVVGNIMYAANSANLYSITTEPVGTWTTITHDRPSPLNTWFKSSQDGTLYSASLVSGTNYDIYKSTNLGSNWSLALNVDNIIGTWIIRDNLILNNNRVSYDGGATWTTNNLVGNQVKGVAELGGNLFVATDMGVFISNDNGLNFTFNSTKINAVTAYEIEFNGTDYYASTLKGIYRSTDNGLTWFPIIATGTFSSVGGRLTFPDSSTMINAVGDKIYKYTSPDGGDTWNLLSQTTYSVGSTAYRLLTDINDPNIIYLASWATTATGVWRSTDKGDTWSQYNTGLGSVRAQTIAQASDGTIYIGTQYNGAYRLNAGTWEAINTGLPASPSFVDIKVTPDGKVWGAQRAVGGNGVYVFDPGAGNWVQVQVDPSSN